MVCRGGKGINLTFFLSFVKSPSGFLLASLARFGYNPRAFNLIIAMETVELSARKRSKVRSAKVVRRAGFIPGEVYGGGKENVSVEFNYQDFRRAYIQSGENTLVNLSLGEGEPHTVLVHDVQLDPVTGRMVHVDLLNVRMDQEVHTHIPLEFVGVSPAVKDMSGTLLTSLSQLEVKCLPKDLVHSFKVDVSSLVDFHTAIHVKDIPVPAGIRVLDDMDATVVTAVPPLKEEEIAPTPAEGAAVAGAEGAVPAEGAAAAVPGAAAPVEGAAAEGKKK